MILRVGLTGGIASGKSTAAGFFRDLGCFVLDMDRLVSALYAPGAAGHQALIDTYGEGILRPDGSIDRAALADRAFVTPEEAARLNALIHPLVLQETDRALEVEASRREGQHFIAMVEATLLLEAGGRARFDRVVVVDLPRPTQIERAVGRGMTRADAVRRMEHQMPREARIRLADYVISNSGNLAALRRACQYVHDCLLRDLAAAAR